VINGGGSPARPQQRPDFVEDLVDLRVREPLALDGVRYSAASRNIGASVVPVGGAGLRAILARPRRRCHPVALFERFTERARQVVVLAHEEANGFKHDHIGTEHILLGLVRDREGIAAGALGSFDITVERVRGEIVRIVGIGQEVVAGQMPLTPHSKRVLELALREALNLGHNYIGTEHILLGLVALKDGVAARILVDIGVTPAQIRSEVIRTLSAAGGPRRPPGAPRRPYGQQEPSGFDDWLRVGPGAGARGLLIVAARRALDDGRSEIEARDVLLALTRDETIAPVLADLGVDEAGVLEALARRRGPHAPPQASAEG
jgi:ATP-dependent Clp protease ATP-binding subunit ClpC